MFCVECGIKIPKPSRKVIKYPFRQMNVGDSFFVEGERKKGKAHQASKMFRSRNKDYKFLAEHEGNGIRIWRIDQ